MSNAIWINLHVKDVKAAVDFFRALGLEIDDEFTNEQAGCVNVAPGAKVLLVSEDFFTSVTGKRLPDLDVAQEVALALEADSREHVDQLVDLARDNGGKESKEPEDHGFMYSRGFRDLDGHLWNVMYMAVEA